MDLLYGARNKLAIVGVSGLMFTGAMFGVASLASAETPEPVPTDEADEANERDHGEVSDFDGFSAEDRALIERFEQCLAEAGVDEEAGHGDEAELTEQDYEALDEVFERCEQILDELSFDSQEWLEPGEGHFNGGDFEYFEISPEDEELFERFEQCLVDEDYARLESVFEGCESILEDLSEGTPFFFEDCPDDEDGNGHELDEDDLEDGGLDDGVQASVSA